MVNTKKKRPMSLERLTIVPHTSQCCARAININSLEKTEILAFWHHHVVLLESEFTLYVDEKVELKVY